MCSGEEASRLTSETISPKPPCVWPAVALVVIRLLPIHRGSPSPGPATTSPAVVKLVMAGYLPGLEKNMQFARIFMA
jgi:hypothetical protein